VVACAALAEGRSAIVLRGGYWSCGSGSGGTSSTAPHNRHHRCKYDRRLDCRSTTISRGDGNDDSGGVSLSFVFDLVDLREAGVRLEQQRTYAPQHQKGVASMADRCDHRAVSAQCSASSHFRLVDEIGKTYETEKTVCGS
jgi:hypothetical protein